MIVIMVSEVGRPALVVVVLVSVVNVVSVLVLVDVLVTVAFPVWLLVCVAEEHFP